MDDAPKLIFKKHETPAYQYDHSYIKIKIFLDSISLVLNFEFWI